MSQRFAHGGTGSRQTSNKGFAKSQKVFVPKNQAQNQTPTLSNSLRQSLSHHSDSAEPITVQAGDGNFVNYLPQDEAVAAGLGADEGGLDPVESQRVVDLLNRELSRLLKLSPKEFWREGKSQTSKSDVDNFRYFFKLKIMFWCSYSCQWLVMLLCLNSWIAFFNSGPDGTISLIMEPRKWSPELLSGSLN